MNRQTNRQTQQTYSAANLHFAELYRHRLDEACHDIVNHGIAVQSHYNTVCAIEYLKSRNIAAEVIERVLSQPALRRKEAGKA